MLGDYPPFNVGENRIFLNSFIFVFCWNSRASKVNLACAFYSRLVERKKIRQIRVSYGRKVEGRKGRKVIGDKLMFVQIGCWIVWLELFQVLHVIRYVTVRNRVAFMPVFQRLRSLWFNHQNRNLLCKRRLRKVEIVLIFAVENNAKFILSIFVKIQKM